MNSVCARTAVWLCVHPAGITGASAASLISQHHGTCLNSKRGLERTSWPPGESLRLPSTHSGHSSYHTLFNYTMSNPPVGLKKKTALKCVWCAYLLTDWRWGVDLRQWDFFLQYVGHAEYVAWFLQVAKGKTVPRLYHKYLFPFNNA